VYVNAGNNNESEAPNSLYGMLTALHVHAGMTDEACAEAIR